MNQLLLLSRSLRHTPAKQLLARILLITRRRSRDSILRGNLRRKSHLPPPKPSGQPPIPILSARTGQLLDTGSTVSVDLVGTVLPFSVPMDWNTEQLERGSLEMLTLHYTEFLEGMSDVESIMLDWISANPSNEVGAWRDAWNSYAISIRCVVWMQQIAAHTGSFTAAGLEVINVSLATQIRFLERNLELDIRGNHLVKNLKCLMWASRYFDGTESDTWFLKGEGLLREVVAEQILSDGMHFERSASYHNQVLADLAECYSLMDDSQTKSDLGSTLDSMAQVSIDLTHPDGYPSMMNDGGLTMAYGPAEIRRALTFIGREPPEQQQRVELPDAGYFGVRNGDDLLLIDCGPIGPDALPAHAHGDVLSFEWSINGERVIVDSGVYEYRVGDDRDYARSTMAHNTVSVAGADQAEFWSSFRVGRRPSVTLEHFQVDNEQIRLAGAHDGFSRLGGSPIHHRSFDVTKRTVRIEDRVDGGIGQSVTAGLLIPGSLPLDRTDTGYDVRAEGFLLRITSSAELTIEAADYSTDMGVRHNATRILAHYGPAPTSGDLVLSIIDLGTEE